MKEYNKANIPLAKALRKNMIPWERKLWYEFLKSYPIRFQSQKAIGNYIVDFFISHNRIVIELDGSQHGREENKQADDMRDFDLKKLGITVLRYTNRDIDRRFKGVCWDIKRHLDLL